MLYNRIRTILHSNNLGELSTYRVELPSSVADGTEAIDRAVRSAYVQGFAAGAQYSSDHEVKFVHFEAQFADKADKTDTADTADTADGVDKAPALGGKHLRSARE